MNQEKLLFTKHIAVMLQSGVSILEAIDIICKQTKNNSFAKIVKKIYKDVQGGLSLHDALKKYPRVFNKLYLHFIQVGEESGNLEENLLYLSEQLEKEQNFNKNIRGALLYPMIILLTAFGVGAGISIFVLPQLVTLFQSMDIELPLSTKIIIWIAEYMKRFGLITIIAFILGAIGFYKIFHTRALRPIWDKALLKLPVLGIFVSRVELAVFCRNMGIMLKSGVPILTTLQTLRESTKNTQFQSMYEKMYKAVEKGESIEVSLNGISEDRSPLIMRKMIGVGEKTGKLENSFSYLGAFFENEAADMSKNFTTVLEPIILLGVGLVVAFLALSIISPIYQFTGSIRR